MRSSSSAHYRREEARPTGPAGRLRWRLADFAEIFSAELELLEKDALRSARADIAATRLESRRQRIERGDREP